MPVGSSAIGLDVRVAFKGNGGAIRRDVNLVGVFEVGNRGSRTWAGSRHRLGTKEPQ